MPFHLAWNAILPRDESLTCLQPRTLKDEDFDSDDDNDEPSSIIFDSGKSENSGENFVEKGRQVRTRKRASYPADDVREPFPVKDRRYQTEWIMRRQVRCKVCLLLFFSPLHERSYFGL